MMQPYPNRNSVLVLDNCSIHKNQRVLDMFAEHGASPSLLQNETSSSFFSDRRVIFLPTYSPDYNPIEKGFSIIKARWERTGNLHTAVDVLGEIARAVEETFTASLMRNLYRSCGY